MAQTAGTPGDVISTVSTVSRDTALCENQFTAARQIRGKPKSALKMNAGFGYSG